MQRPDERSDARERTLYLLYEAHSKGLDPRATIDLQVIEPDGLTQELVRGVGEHLPALDALIGAKARGWTLARMPVLDLNVMRLAVYELLWRDDVPDSVAISEAVRLVTELSTEQSPPFVNGLLSRIATLKDSLVQNGGTSVSE